MSKKQNPWTYYYAVKDALSMIDAYFVFTNKDDSEYSEIMDKLYEVIARLGTKLAEVKNIDS